MTKIVKILQEVRHNNHGELVQFQAWKIKFAKLQQNLMQRKKDLEFISGVIFFEERKVKFRRSIQSHLNVSKNLCPNFLGFCPEFRQIKNGVQAQRTACSYTTVPIPLHTS